MSKMGPEARARLAAESELLRKRKAEFERLLKTKDRNAAIVAMIDKHKIEYSDLVKSYRARFEMNAPAA